MKFPISVSVFLFLWNPDTWDDVFNAILYCLAAGIRDFGTHVVNAFREPIECSLTGRRIRQGSGRQTKLISRESADHVVRGLRRGVRALSDNAVWPLIDLSSQGLHITQQIVEVSLLQKVLALTIVRDFSKIDSKGRLYLLFGRKLFVNELPQSEMVTKRLVKIDSPMLKHHNQ